MDNKSPWRFVKAALKIRCETPAQKLLMILLAGYANKDGVCWPSYATLMRRSGLGSENTVIAALKYMRNTLKIITWTKGWGNQHGHSKPNIYRFDYEAMSALLASEDSALPAEETALDAESTVEETALDVESTSRKLQSVQTKVLDQSINVQKNTKARGQSSGPALPSVDFQPEAEHDRRQASSLEQTALSADSSLSALSAESSIVVSPALCYYSDTRKWGARPDIDRPLTHAEIAEINRLNENRVRPN